MICTRICRGLVFVCAVLAAAVLTGSCGDTAPSGAAESFLKAALENDCAKMVELSSSESLGGQTRDEAVRECEVSGDMAQLYGTIGEIELKDFETLEEDISVGGDEATVKARLTLKVSDDEESVEQTFMLVLEEGEWRVSL